MRSFRLALVVTVALASAFPAAAQDAEDCQDHPLFTRFPGMHIAGCQASQFDLRGFPVGPKVEEGTLKAVEVEGPVRWLSYQIDEGVTPPSGLQIMRNFENAAKNAGGTIEGRYPGWCQAGYDQERMPDMGNGCTSYGLTIKFARGGKETWTFLQASEDEGSYQLTVSERQAMSQDISVNELADTLTRDGFLTLYVTFDTGKATLTPDSSKILDDAAGALKLKAELQIEVGGHTDNVGTPESNQQLSDARAKTVMAALVQRGVDGGRLTAKGYGQSVPIADNRTEDGRAKNRRVELTKRSGPAR
jgi:outer membrane protein OmpA-like peptidoglycan-associated protein